jgi:arylsulfatase A-like enzyme
VPDVVVQPNPGGLYSFSTKKVAEHGGGAPDDRHVALLVMNPRHHKGGGSDNAAVTTTEVAPTVLRFLGLNPHALDAVREEGTKVLPGA